MIFILLKVLAIAIILAVLSLPFWPYKFSFSLSSVGYRHEYKWRNICFFIESLLLAFIIVCFAPLIKNLFDWLFGLGFVKWFTKFIPKRVTYAVSVLIIIASNILITAIFVGVKKFFRSVLDRTVFKNTPIINNTKDKKRKKSKIEPSKKDKDSMLKRLKQLKRDSILVFKNEKKKKAGAVVSSDYMLNDRDDQQETEIPSEEMKYDDDTPVTLEEFIKSLWFRFIGLFYNKEDNFRFIKTSVFRWANELKYFLFFVSVIYAVVFVLILVPVFFPIAKSNVFYTIAKWLVDNTYLYPMISIVLLFELLGFINGDHKKPDEAKDPHPFFATGAGEKSHRDFESHRKFLLEKYGESYKIKNFSTESSSSKSSYNLSEKKKSIQNIAKAIRANKKILNVAYMQGVEAMLEDKHILFDSSLYSSLGEYIIHCLFVKLSFGSRILFICKDEKEIEKASDYLENGFLNITKTNQSLWRICTLHDMYKGQKPDILMLTPEQFLEKDIFIYGKPFFSELVDVFIPDIDEILEANNYYCLIMAKKLEMYTNFGKRFVGFEPDIKAKAENGVRFRFLSNGHIHSIENSIRQFFNLGDAELEAFNSFGLSSKNDVFVWHTGVSSTLYVDNGANQVSLEVQIAKDAEENGISNVSLISGTTLYNSHLNEIHGLNVNNYDSSEGDTGYVVVADDEFDLPNVIYNYARYSGRISSVLHIISKPYLLRDYFTARAENYVSRFELIGETMCEHADPAKAGIILLLCDAVNGIEKNTFLKRAAELLAVNIDSNDNSDSDEKLNDVDDCVKHCYETAFGKLENYQPRYTIRRYLNSKLETVKYIRLEDSNSLFKKLLETTKTVKLEYVNTQSVEHIPVFKSMIAQYFIPGQIITRNNRAYTIKDVSVNNGTLFLDDTGASVNIPMDYIQTRIYHINNTVSKRTFGPDYRAKDCTVYHVGFEIMNANVTVDTVGYYSIEKAVQNVDLVKPNFAKYINLRSNPGLSEKLRRNIDTKMLVVDLSINTQSDPKLTYSLTVILNEMMKTVFPKQYRCISVCPLFEDVDEDEFFAGYEAIRDLYPTAIFENKSDDVAENAEKEDRVDSETADNTENEAKKEAKKDGHIRFVVIEDTRDSNGVIETLVDGEGLVVTNLLHIVADFLGWALSATGNDFNYLNFGYQKCPEIFDLPKLEAVLRQFRHEIELSELVKKKSENTCFFCHKTVNPNECQQLEDGRVICLDCVESSVNSFEALENLFESVLSSIKKSTSVPESFYKDMSCDFVSTKELVERYGEDSENIPVGYCNHATHSIYIEYGLPAVAAAGIMARLITELWQDANIASDGSPLYDGHLDYVELQVLYALGYNSEADALSEIHAANKGFAELKQLLNNEGTSDSFAVLLGSSVSEIKKKKKPPVDPKNPEDPENPENPEDPDEPEEPDIPEPEDPDIIISERTPDDIPRFWYNRMSDDEKAVYDQIYKAITEFQPSLGTPYVNIDVEKFKDVYDRVFYDNPDIFWITRNNVRLHYNATDNCVKDADFHYVMTKSETARRKKKIEASVKSFFKGISPAMSDYMVALRAYENIVDLIDYDSIGLDQQKRDAESYKKPDNLRSIYGVFVEKKAVCAGYAIAFQYLLNRMGIECTYVRGQCNDPNNTWHAWNLVKLEGEYYYVDVTNGDPSNTNPNKHHGNFVMYDYFAVTTKEILKSRNISDSECYPECKAIACNYFVRNKLYFREYDAKVINRIVTDNLENGNKIIALKFSSKQLYDLCYDRLITGHGLFDIINNSNLKKKPTSFSNYLNNGLNVLTILLDK